MYIGGDAVLTYHTFSQARNCQRRDPPLQRLLALRIRLTPLKTLSKEIFSVRRTRPPIVQPTHSTSCPHPRGKNPYTSPLPPLAHLPNLDPLPPRRRNLLHLHPSILVHDPRLVWDLPRRRPPLRWVLQAVQVRLHGGYLPMEIHCGVPAVSRTSVPTDILPRKSSHGCRRVDTP